jgi:hypothetical protein
MLRERIKKMISSIKKRHIPVIAWQVNSRHNTRQSTSCSYVMRNKIRPFAPTLMQRKPDCCITQNRFNHHFDYFASWRIGLSSSLRMDAHWSYFLLSYKAENIN